MRIATIALSCLLAGAVPAAAYAADADKSIKYRRGVFQVIVWDFGPMGAMVKGKIPFDKAAFARHAERVAAMGPRIVEGFGKGTEKGDVASRAKPEIWSDRDGFEAAAQRLIDESKKLASVAAGGDESAMKKQFAATGKSCKGCHDDYRAKKK